MATPVNRDIALMRLWVLTLSGAGSMRRNRGRRGRSSGLENLLGFAYHDEAGGPGKTRSRDHDRYDEPRHEDLGRHAIFESGKVRRSPNVTTSRHLTGRELNHNFDLLALIDADMRRAFMTDFHGAIRRPQWLTHR